MIRSNYTEHSFEFARYGYKVNVLYISIAIFNWSIFFSFYKNAMRFLFKKLTWTQYEIAFFFWFCPNSLAQTEWWVRVYCKNKRNILAWWINCSSQFIYDICSMGRFCIQYIECVLCIIDMHHMNISQTRTRTAHVLNVIYIFIYKYVVCMYDCNWYL